MTRVLLVKIKELLEGHKLVVICFVFLSLVCLTYYVAEKGNIFKTQKVELCTNENPGGDAGDEETENSGCLS